MVGLRKCARSHSQLEYCLSSTGHPLRVCVLFSYGYYFCVRTLKKIRLSFHQLPKLRFTVDVTIIWRDLLYGGLVLPQPPFSSHPIICTVYLGHFEISQYGPSCCCLQVFHNLNILKITKPYYVKNIKEGKAYFIYEMCTLSFMLQANARNETAWTFLATVNDCVLCRRWGLFLIQLIIPSKLKLGII